MSAPTDKLLVFLTEGPEGWDTPIADLVAACGDMGQKAMLIDLTKPDASAQLNKAAGEGITAFVSMEGVGSRMTANGRSIYELLQTPLLTFLPDHPCFYAPVLTTPQKLVVPMFFSREHVTAARGIFGNVPLAPVVAAWGPRTTSDADAAKEGIVVDADSFKAAGAFATQHPMMRRLLEEVLRELDPLVEHPVLGAVTAVRRYERRCEETRCAPRPDALGDDVYAALVRVADTRWLPLGGFAAPQLVSILSLVLNEHRVRHVREHLDRTGSATAVGRGWPSTLEPRLVPAPSSGSPVEWRDPCGASQTNLLIAARAERREDPLDASSAIGELVRASESARFLEFAVKAST